MLGVNSAKWRGPLLLSMVLSYVLETQAFTSPLNRPSHLPFLHSQNEEGAKSIMTLSMSTDVEEDLYLTPELVTMVEGFKRIPDEKIRYKNLMYLANNLAPVGDEVRVRENKVPGCLSTVHVTCDIAEDDNGRTVVNYRGDSDGVLTKGLLALLVRYVMLCYVFFSDDLYFVVETNLCVKIVCIPLRNVSNFWYKNINVLIYNCFRVEVFRAAHLKKLKLSIHDSSMLQVLHKHLLLDVTMVFST